MKKAYILIITLYSMTFLISCNNKTSKYILEEDFQVNNLGWIEENTEYHHVELIDGKYYINSTDSSMGQTSCNSLDDSYLYRLGASKYEIITEFEYLMGDSNSDFGLLLRSATLEYRFALYQSGLIEVVEYSGTKEYETIIISDSTTMEEMKVNSKYSIYIVINGDKFEFYVNSHLIGEDNFRTKSWSDLRLYSGRLTAINIDYLKIR